MPFAVFDDNYADHPKISGLSDSAFRLNTAGILHCARLLTNGRVRRAQVAALVPRFRQRALDELLSVKLWTPTDDGEGYEIHDYLDWNDSRESVLGRRAQARDRKAAQRRRQREEDDQ